VTTELIKSSVKFHKNVHDQIVTISEKNGVSFSEIVRKLVDKGLSERVYEEYADLIAQSIRHQLELVMKPHIERLAVLSSKSGHMSATAAFLNVQALMDLVPKEQRKDVRVFYENARKKAASYMATKADSWKIGIEDELNNR